MPWANVATSVCNAGRADLFGVAVSAVAGVMQLTAVGAYVRLFAASGRSGTGFVCFASRRCITGKTFDDRASRPVAAAFACANERVQRSADCAEVADFLRDQPSLLLGERPRFHAVRADRQREQQLDFFEGESQGLCAFYELQPGNRILRIPAHRRIVAFRYRHETEPLVVADRFDVNATAVGQAADRHA